MVIDRVYSCKLSYPFQMISIPNEKYYVLTSTVLSQQIIGDKLLLILI